MIQACGSSPFQGFPFRPTKMGAAEPLASAELFTVVILLSKGRERCALRACSNTVQSAGNNFIKRYQKITLSPSFYQRLMFWAPWTHYRTIRLEGSLMLSRYHEAMEALAPGAANRNRHRNGQSFTVHGHSSPTLMHKVFVEDTWMPELQFHDGRSHMRPRPDRPVHNAAAW